MTGIHLKKNFECEMLTDMATTGWQVAPLTPLPGTPAEDLWLHEGFRKQREER